MKITAELQERFRQRYGGRARVYRAPGRVNLIGEHTDYNDGFVMPAAIEFYVWIAIAPRSDRKLLLHSTNFSETVEIDLQNSITPRNHWSDYVAGVAVMLQRASHHLQGANLLIQGDVPMGSGLSSSAAIEVALELVKLCRRAENEFVGARVGIMDQFVSSCGQAGHALMLDCRSLEYSFLPLPRDVSLVICNTMVKHALASGEYNTRRAECEEGMRLLSRSMPSIRALRDVSLTELEAHAGTLPKLIYKRCRHVISENARVTKAAASLEQEDLDNFGLLMAESHRSLRDEYEVSCAELDLMVELAGQQRGVYGARMTGGGFGGCTINLVRTDAVNDFQFRVADAYQKSTGRAPQIFVSPAAEGADEVKK
ncbi:MAG: galactokinase [Acidobacteriales bacterium 13_1_40CM_3_55_5]|nr:MAG: galactokinase [Acidobacteriales bacterium 13_1_40CM_3_55_5]